MSVTGEWALSVTGEWALSVTGEWALSVTWEWALSRIGQDTDGSRPRRVAYAPSMEEVLEGLRAICEQFPEVSERPSHGSPTWFVRGRAFANVWLDGHHRNTFPHLWCAALPGVQDALVSMRPDAFFRPPYVGQRGWLGIRLDRGIDLDELADLLLDAYCAVAPTRLASLVGGAGDA